MAFTLTPFLYQTRTLQRLTRSPSTVHALRYLSTRRPHQALRPKTDPIPFELPPELESESPDKKVEAEERDPDGTITPSERQTFQRIFQEIADRAPPTKSPPSRSFREQTFTPEGESAINVIIRDAASKAGRSNAGQGDDAYSASAREEALLRFPASLRQAARQALGVSQHDGRGDSEAFTASSRQYSPLEDDIDDHAVKEETILEALAETRQIETQRKEERTRVEQLMRDAKTDFELWDILEAEVFTMVERLGIGQGAMDKLATSGKRGGRKKQSKETRATTRSAKSTSTALSMEVHGPLYPAFLLFALQLFDQHFSSPSRLSFSILPRVKELGLASYVLGINVPFYNELIQIYWRRYGDANAVLSLLEEMRHAGVSFDDTSLTIVDSIKDFYGQAFTGAKGQWRQALMAMPEFEPILEMRARYWINNIKADMRKRERDMAQ